MLSPIILHPFFSRFFKIGLGLLFFTIVAPTFTSYMGNDGNVITEEVFARPGLGQLLLQAILAKDIPLVQALVVYMTAVYIFLNLIVDFTYGIIDPRIRLERNRG